MNRLNGLNDFFRLGNNREEEIIVGMKEVKTKITITLIILNVFVNQTLTVT